MILKCLVKRKPIKTIAYEKLSFELSIREKIRLQLLVHGNIGRVYSLTEI